MAQITCTNCSQSSDVKLKMNLFGFRKFKCPQCDTENTLPLSDGYKAVYASFVIIFAVSFVWNLVMYGIISFPGIFVLLFGIILLKDRKMRGGHWGFSKKGVIIVAIFAVALPLLNGYLGRFYDFEGNGLERSINIIQLLNYFILIVVSSLILKKMRPTQAIAPQNQ